MPAGISTPGCYDMLERDYKFYLSFENSICVDYVTEKFFAILDYNVVPVVLGGANYSRFAPPNSYIDALQYTPRQLANYLKLLDSNQTLYEQYFEWKKHYVVHRGLRKMTKDAFCHLCEKLHNDGERKVYNNLQETWSAEAQCPEPTFYKQRSF
jgi:alpha-1,3-fucosyltransferase